MARLCCLLLLALSCGRGTQGDAADSLAVDSVDAVPRGTGRQTDRDSLIMPDIPTRTARQIAMASVALANIDFEIDGSWEASAIHCPDSNYVHLIARAPTFGAVLVMALPDSGEAELDYDVSPRYRGALRDSTARVGYHIFGGEQPYVFRGDSGVVSVQRMDSVLTGTVEVGMGETTLREVVLMAAAFELVPVRPAREGECELVQSRGS